MHSPKLYLYVEDISLFRQDVSGHDCQKGLQDFERNKKAAHVRVFYLYRTQNNPTLSLGPTIFG